MDNPQITDADLQLLLAQNPLAAEQLRRIMAERQKEELKAELAALKGESLTPVDDASSNGKVKEAVIAES